MTLPERRPPTHILTVEIPLNLDNGKGNFDPVQDAISTCLAVSRAAYVGSICDGGRATLVEAPPPV